MTHRPCGACAELVPAATGCVHWKPGARPHRRSNREYQEAARARARRDVAEFHRVMASR